jgi:DNA-directed RNA polymerase II subunit RPB7
MFFLKELEKTIQLHPSYFGPLIRSHIHKELLQKEEGSSTGKYTIVCILDSFDITDGQVMPGSGSAEYTVHYKAIVWRPYKGEVVRWNSMNEYMCGWLTVSRWMESSPRSCPLASSWTAALCRLSSDVAYESLGNVGAGACTDLAQMIPSDIKFEGNAAPPQWTDGADQVIEKGTNIRIKIKGIRSEVDKMFAVGTMKEVGTALVWSLRCFSSLTFHRITSAPCHRSLANPPMTIRIRMEVRSELLQFSLRKYHPCVRDGLNR